MKSISVFLLAAIIGLGFLVRVWDLTSTPSSLYWDEMDVGYQAYSILRTGRDYFGNTPGLIIQSFADYRAPVFIYSLIPFVAGFGLNPYTVRIPAAIFGIVSVFFIYILGKILFRSERIGLIAALFVAFSPWSIQFGRIGFETTLMLALVLGGIISFLMGAGNSKLFILSGVLFSVALFTYNTAKLFVPLIFLSLVFITQTKYLKVRKRMDKVSSDVNRARHTGEQENTVRKNFWIGSGILAVIFLLGLYSSIFQGGGKRFSEISVLTDPQMEAKIDLYRSDSALSYTQSEDVGQEARLLDKIIYNKATFILDRITQNYLTAFSPQFLFISGDPNLRHSPERIGEFYRVEFITILVGLGFLLFNIRKNRNQLLLLIWIILAPLPAAITRDGGFHATRLALLFPALSLVSAAGLNFLLITLPKRIKFLTIGLLSAVWLFSFGFFANYYFGAYKIESAKYFQFGFSEAVKKAVDHKETQDYVIIDDRRDSALMNYLFDSKYDPALFQHQIKNLPLQISGIKSSKLGNIVFLDPDARDWANIFAKNLIDKNFLLVVSAEQFQEQTIEKVPNKLTKNQKFLDVVYYQNGDVAFYLIQSKKPGSN